MADLVVIQLLRTSDTTEYKVSLGGRSEIVKVSGCLQMVCPEDSQKEADYQIMRAAKRLETAANG